MIKHVIALLIVLSLYGVSLADTHTAANCTHSAVNTAIGLASNGDTVAVPSGECTWTTINTVTINKEITLQGAGIGSTIISVNGSGYATICNVTSANVTITGFTFTSTSGPAYTINLASTSGNFRITGNTFDGTGCTAIFITRSYGVIDNNTFNFSAGNDEFIQSRGPCDAWTEATGLGGADFVFVENNTMANSGYIDMQADSRTVFRYNTITGGIKFDAHQWRDSTNEGCDNHKRGARAWEIYNNQWTLTSGYFTAIDLKGGTGVVYGNRILNAVEQAVWVKVQEYCSMYTNCTAYAPNCSCADDYPIPYQFGRGDDNSSEPAYFWNNKSSYGGAGYVDWEYAAYSNYMPLMDVSTCATVEQCGELFAATDIIQSDRDIFLSISKPDAVSAYTYYTCPHPLTGLTGSCNSSVAGTSGYNVNPVSTNQFTGSLGGSLH